MAWSVNWTSVSCTTVFCAMMLPWEGTFQGITGAKRVAEGWCVKTAHWVEACRINYSFRCYSFHISSLSLSSSFPPWQALLLCTFPLWLASWSAGVLSSLCQSHKAGGGRRGRAMEPCSHLQQQTQVPLLKGDRGWRRPRHSAQASAGWHQAGEGLGTELRDQLPGSLSSKLRGVYQRTQWDSSRPPIHFKQRASQINGQKLEKCRKTNTDLNMHVIHAEWNADFLRHHWRVHGRAKAGRPEEWR